MMKINEVFPELFSDHLYVDLPIFPHYYIWSTIWLIVWSNFGTSCAIFKASTPFPSLNCLKSYPKSPKKQSLNHLKSSLNSPKQSSFESTDPTRFPEVTASPGLQPQRRPWRRAPEELCWNNLLSSFISINGDLVGGWTTPMKTISQLGWWFPMYGK